MFELNAGELISRTNLMERLISITDESQDDVDISKDNRNIMLKTCDTLTEFIDGCGLKATNRAVSRLVGNLQKPEPLTYRECKTFASDILLRMRDELELTKCIVIEPHRLQFYEPERPLFGKVVMDHYPSAYFEIEEAGKCLALGRSTACVFHLMRILEVGIRAIASSLSIPDPSKPSEKNWGVILKRINEAVKGRQRWRRKADKIFYEEAVASLDSVKNPWRNATMHVEKTYTEEEAENIFYAVRAFMMKIASGIDENGKLVP